jgi:hypothetical protein
VNAAQKAWLLAAIQDAVNQANVQLPTLHAKKSLVDAARIAAIASGGPTMPASDLAVYQQLGDAQNAIGTLSRLYDAINAKAPLAG